LRIISRRALREFWEKHPEAETSLAAWYSVTRKAVWNNLAETKQTFSSADLVDTCTVFNVGGNNYRVIVKIEYEWQVVYIKNVLTHAEYSRGRWRRGCTS
jgi:mRNA interferase HigB